MNPFSLQLLFVRYLIRALKKVTNATLLQVANPESEGLWDPSKHLSTDLCLICLRFHLQPCASLPLFPLHTLHFVWPWLETAKISVQTNVHNKEHSLTHRSLELFKVSPLSRVSNWFFVCLLCFCLPWQQELTLDIRQLQESIFNSLWGLYVCVCVFTKKIMRDDFFFPKYLEKAGHIAK